MSLHLLIWLEYLIISQTKILSKPYITKKNNVYFGGGRPYLRKKKNFGEGEKKSRRRDGISGTILPTALSLVGEIVKVFK